MATKLNIPRTDGDDPVFSMTAEKPVIDVEVEGCVQSPSGKGTNGRVLVNGTPIPLKAGQYVAGGPYFAKSREYAAAVIGHLTESGGFGCRTVLVISLRTGRHHFENVHEDIRSVWFAPAGKGGLDGLEEWNPSSVIFSELMALRSEEMLYMERTDGLWVLDCGKLLQHVECVPLHSYSIPSGTFGRGVKRLEELFTYTVTDKMDLMIRLKKEYEPDDLLDFGCFSNEYDAFKLCWTCVRNCRDCPSCSEFTENILMLSINTGDHTTKEGCHSPADRFRLVELLKSAAIVLPYHPALSSARYYLRKAGPGEKERAYRCRPEK